MAKYDGADFAHGCAFLDLNLNNGYCHYFQRWDGTFVYECWCEKDLLDTYEWESGWNFYSSIPVHCASLYFRGLDTIVPFFKDVDCGTREMKTANVDTKSNMYQLL